MQFQQLHPLDRLHWEQRRFRLCGRSESRGLYLLECADGSGIQRELPFIDVETLIKTGQLIVEKNVFAPDGSIATHGHPAFDLASARRREQLLAFTDLIWVQELDADHKAGLVVLYDRADGQPRTAKGAATISHWIQSKQGIVSEKVRQLSVLEASEPAPAKRKNRSTLVIDPAGRESLKRNLKIYRSPGFCIRDLLKHWDRCTEGGLRIAPEVAKIIVREAKDLLGREGRMNIAGLCTHIRAKVLLELGSAAKLPSRGAVERCILQLDDWSLYAARFGLKRAREKRGSKSEGPRYTKVGEMLYMDSWKVDIVTLLEEAGVWMHFNREARRVLSSRKRVWLCVALDAASRVVVSFGFGLTESSTLARRVLRMALSGGNPALGKAGALAPTLPRIGWHALATDGGPAFRHAWFQVPAITLFAKVKVGIAGTPWRQGIKERLFGTVKSQLLPYFTGLTFGNPVEKGDYDAEARASLALEQFGDALFRYFHDVYACRSHSGLLDQPPINFAAEALEGMGAPPPPSDQQLEIAFGHDVELPLTARGLCFHGIVYQNAWLAQMFSRNGPRQLRVKVDTVNLGRIYVLHERHWQVIAGPPEIQGRGLTEWVAFIGSLRQRHRAQAEVNFHVVAKALVDLENIGRQARVEAKLTDESYNSDAVKQAAHNNQLRIIYRPLPTAVSAMAISKGTYGDGYETDGDAFQDEGVVVAESPEPELNDVPEESDEREGQLEDDDSEDLTVNHAVTRSKAAVEKPKDVHVGSLRDLKALRNRNK